MGLLSWFRGGNKQVASSSSSLDSTSKSAPNTITDSKSQASSQKQELPGMNGAVEVSRPLSLPDVTVFEFGSVSTSVDKVTIAGYCPVSEELEPCRWEILPASGSDAPQIRVVF